MQITYIALRNIKAGNTAGTSYTIDVDVEPYTAKAFSKGKTITKLSGSQKRITQHKGLNYSIKTTLIALTGETPDDADFKQFLNSVNEGEAFTVDGQNVRLDSLNNPYQENYASPIYRTYAFKLRVL